ncbi:MAG: cation:proton antiporter [Proteobacteria bacterium]|nr:cation:proton antiporter [Pseudomonadota bacterium]MDA1354827.1 cation:proton antiporter [Pseudomonadota bacterium]
MDIPETHLDELLFALVIILGASAGAMAIAKRFRLSPVIGLFATGFVVGPSVLGITQNVSQLREIAEFGVVLLLFVVGLEMAPRKLWAMRTRVFGLGSLQVAVSGALLFGFLVATALPWNVALVVGLALALSSTAFVAQILSERAELNTETGRTSISILILQDMAVVPLLAMVPLISEGAPQIAGEPIWLRALMIIGVIAIVLLIGRFVLPVLLTWTAKRRFMDVFAVLSMLAMLASAWAMEFTGLSMALGAFLIGVTLSVSDYRHQVEAAVLPYKGLLLGLFFLSVGMSIDIAVIKQEWVRVIFSVLAVIGIKIAVLIVLCAAFRVSRRATIRTAFLLSQSGEFGFVLLGSALASGLVGEDQFAFALVVISVSMAATPVFVKLGNALADLLERAGRTSAHSTAADWGEEKYVVVTGIGRVGRIVCDMLKASDIPYIAFDVDIEKVVRERKLGHHVRFGDVSDPHVLTSGELARAAAAVVTLNDKRACEKVVSALRNFYPEMPVHVRVYNFEDRDAMLERGVVSAIPETVEASLELGADLLQHLGISDSEVQDLLGILRADGYARIRSGEERGG